MADGRAITAEECKAAVRARVQQTIESINGLGVEGLRIGPLPEGASVPQIIKHLTTPMKAKLEQLAGVADLFPSALNPQQLLDTITQFETALDNGELDRENITTLVAYINQVRGLIDNRQVELLFRITSRGQDRKAISSALATISSVLQTLLDTADIGECLAARAVANGPGVALGNAAAAAQGLPLRSRDARPANRAAVAFRNGELAARVNDIQQDKVSLEEAVAAAARDLADAEAAPNNGNKANRIKAIKIRAKILTSVLNFYTNTILPEVQFIGETIQASLASNVLSEQELGRAALAKLQEIATMSRRYKEKSIARARDGRTPNVHGETEPTGGPKKQSKAWSEFSTKFSLALKELRDIVEVASSERSSEPGDPENMNTSIKQVLNVNVSLRKQNQGNRNYTSTGQRNIATDELAWFRPQQAASCERIVSTCRGQKAFLLLHAVGSGKSRTALCVAMNTHPSIPITCLVIAGLETAFLDELKKDFFPEEIRKSLERRIRFVSFQQLETLAITLRVAMSNKPADADTSQSAQLKRQQLQMIKSEYERYFKNSIVLCDEAHRLYPIMEKSPGGGDDMTYQKELKIILAGGIKVIFMTATPIQKGWDQFGRLVNLMITLNNPFYAPDGTSQRLNIIPFSDDIGFRRNFAPDPSRLQIIGNQIYNLVFNIRKQFDMVINNLYLIAGIVANPETILGVVGGIINAVGADFGVQVDLLAYVQGNSAIAYAATAGVKLGMAMAVANILNTLQSIFAKPEGLLMMDLDKVVREFLPYISFSDYKADEITHAELLEKYNKLTYSITGMDIRARTIGRLPLIGALARKNEAAINATESEIRKIETRLKNYPVLAVRKLTIPYNNLQSSLYHVCTQKGLTPTTGEKHIANLVEIDEEIRDGFPNVTVGTAITPVQTRECADKLRCLGNISMDSYYFDAKLLDAGTEIRGITPAQKANMIANGCYVAKDKSLDILYQYLPNEYIKLKKGERQGKSREQIIKLKKKRLAEMYGLYEHKKWSNWLFRNAEGAMDFKFQCEKYDKIYEIIDEARMKFRYLPIVYSNFDRSGMQTFSAYLTSRGKNHIVIHRDTSIEERTQRIEAATKPYPKFVFSMDLELIDRGLNIRKVVSDNAGFGVRPQEDHLTQIITEQEALRSEPICAIVHPDLQEGLDLKFNEVMICLEPMLGIGNQEQVYGRVVRSVGPDEYEQYEESYAVEDATEISPDNVKVKYLAEKIGNNNLKTTYLDPGLQIISVPDTKQYKEKYENPNDKRKRLQKYVVQILSTYTQQAVGSEQYWQPNLAMKLDNMPLPIVNRLSSLLIGLPIDALAGLIYNNPKEFYENPIAFVRKAGRMEKIQPGNFVRLINWAKSFWNNSIPRVDIKYPFRSVYNFILDAVRRLIYGFSRADIIKGEGEAYVTQGKLNISFPTPDLYWDNEIQTLEIEYKKMRAAFKQVDDSNTVELYDDSPYDGTCDTGQRFYLEAARGAPCKMSTEKTYTRKNVCSKVGPKLTSYFERNPLETRKLVRATPGIRDALRGGKRKLFKGGNINTNRPLNVQLANLPVLPEMIEPGPPPPNPVDPQSIMQYPDYTKEEKQEAIQDARNVVQFSQKFLAYVKQNPGSLRVLGPEEKTPASDEYEEGPMSGGRRKKTKKVKKQPYYRRHQSRRVKH